MNYFHWNTMAVNSMKSIWRPLSNWLLSIVCRSTIFPPTILWYVSTLNRYETQLRIIGDCSVCKPLHILTIHKQIKLIIEGCTSSSQRAAQYAQSKQKYLLKGSDDPQRIQRLRSSSSQLAILVTGKRRWHFIVYLQFIWEAKNDWHFHNVTLWKRIYHVISAL